MQTDLPTRVGCKSKASWCYQVFLEPFVTLSSGKCDFGKAAAKSCGLVLCQAVRNFTHYPHCLVRFGPDLTCGLTQEDAASRLFFCPPNSGVGKSMRQRKRRESGQWIYAGGGNFGNKNRQLLLFHAVHTRPRDHSALGQGAHVAG